MGFRNGMNTRKHGKLKGFGMGIRKAGYFLVNKRMMQRTNEAQKPYLPTFLALAFIL